MDRKRKTSSYDVDNKLASAIDALFTTVDESPLLKHVKEDHPTYQRLAAKNVGYKRVMCLLNGLERLIGFSSSERPMTTLEVTTNHLCSILTKIKTEGTYAWGSDVKDNIAMLLFITDESTNWPFCLFIETVQGWIEESAGEKEGENDIVRCDKLSVAMDYLMDLIRGGNSRRDLCRWCWSGRATTGWMKIAKKVLEHEINPRARATEEEEKEDMKHMQEDMEQLEEGIPEWDELFAIELEYRD